MKIATTAIMNGTNASRLLRPLLIELDLWIGELGDLPLVHSRYQEMSIWFSNMIPPGSTKHHVMKDSDIYAIEVGIVQMSLSELKADLIRAVGEFPYLSDIAILESYFAGRREGQ